MNADDQRRDAGDGEQDEHEAAEAPGVEVAAQGDAGRRAERPGRAGPRRRRPATSRSISPVAANTTMLTMSRTAKTVVIVARKRRWSKCRACSTNTSGGPLTPADIVSAPGQHAAADVEARTGVAQVEAAGDHDDGDEHGDADHHAQHAVVGPKEHEQPDRQPDRGAGEQPPGDAAIGVVAAGPRLVAVGERRQRRGRRSRRRGGRATTDSSGTAPARSRTRPTAARSPPRRRRARRRASRGRRLTRCRCSGASCRPAAAAVARRRAGR